MKRFSQRFLLCIAACIINSSICDVHSAAKSKWVYPDSKGKLGYKTLEGGDKIMDFSFAGYMGGGVSIPSVPVMITVSPSAGDNTNAIQNAIDAVSKMKMVNGFRG